MTRTTANIGQRTSYPRAMRVAVVKSHKTMGTAEVARDYNVSPSTVNAWAKAAKKAKAQPKQLAAHQAAAAAIKVFNTPRLMINGKHFDTFKVEPDPAKATHIDFRGTIYKV